VGLFVLTVPNIITIIRLLSVPVLMWLIVTGEATWAFWLFVAAGVSDALDGFIARSFRARSKLGGYLDPIADKVLLVCTFVALGFEGLLPAWLVWLVVARDVVIVLGVALMKLLKEPIAMQPLAISKVNTAMQIALAAIALSVNGPGFGWEVFVETGIWIVAVTTGWSLVGYILRGLLILRSRNEHRREMAGDAGPAGRGEEP